MKRFISFLTTALLLLSSWALASCGSDDPAPLPPPTPPTPPAQKIEVSGTWRCYFVSSNNTALGWNEFEIAPDGNFTFYDYYTQNDSLGISNGHMVTFEDHFEIQFEGEQQPTSYPISIDQEKFIVHNQTGDETYYFIPEYMQRLEGTWTAVNGLNGKIMHLTLQNHRALFTSTAPNGKVVKEEGNYTADRHVMYIWWASQQSQLQDPVKWYYAVDGKEMFNSYAGGTSWQREGASISSIKALVPEHRKATCLQEHQPRLFGSKISTR